MPVNHLRGKTAHYKLIFEMVWFFSPKEDQIIKTSTCYLPIFDYIAPTGESTLFYIFIIAHATDDAKRN